MPRTSENRRLLVHELTHVVQQHASHQMPLQHAISEKDGVYEREADLTAQQITETKLFVQRTLTSAPQLYLARQCNPAWAGLPWAQRVLNARALAGAARDGCFIDLINEALGGTVTIHSRTNNQPNVLAAIAASAYVEYGSITNRQVNFDWNLNAKAGLANAYGCTRCQQIGNDIRIFVILGPRAVNEIGPKFTEMALEHEETHASQCIIQFALGAPPTIGVAEELEAYTKGFTRFFLDLWTINNTPPCAWRIQDYFLQMFANFGGAGVDAQNRAFENIHIFFDVRIQPDACNLMKFRLWLQDVMNQRPAGDALVARINALPGLGLVRGTNPINHLICPTPCP